MPRIVTSHQGQHDEFLFLFRDDDDDGVVESRAMIGSLRVILGTLRFTIHDSTLFVKVSIFSYQILKNSRHTALRG